MISLPPFLPADNDSSLTRITLQLTEGDQTVYLCVMKKEGAKSVIGCLVAEEVKFVVGSH